MLLSGGEGGWSIMEKVQFEYFVAANWNTLFEGGSIGRGGGGVLSSAIRAFNQPSFFGNH